jgi:guanylate kinase
MIEGRLFVISAPSGAGKTTLLKRVMARISGLSFSVSHTTREPRTGEEDGVDYHFISPAVFLDMVEKGLFLEHAEVHGNFYGTSREGVLKQLKKGTDIVLDIDVQGASIIRRSDVLAGVHIFIAPPCLTELERRLRGRETESEENVGVRLKNAMIEMQAARNYDYLIVNDNLEETVDLLIAIVWAERARSHRLPSGKPITGITE